MYKETIQHSIDYIEDNLKTEITAAELSAAAGFSIFHYYRIFQSELGMPVMQYILRRRLLNAIFEISEGRKMIDAALDYGFDTYAGFYRSFVRELGYTPSQFLENHRVRKPYRINIIREEHIMLSNKRAAQVLVQWGMENEKLADVVYEESGNISESAKYVGDGHVLKYTPNLGSVKRDIAISTALAGAGLNASTVVPSKDGREYVENGELYFYIVKKIYGERVRASRLYESADGCDARFIGEMIGQLSLALSAVDIAADDADTLGAVEQWALPQLAGKLDIERGFIESCLAGLRRLYPQLPRQLIHRDPNPGNIIVSEAGHGFIDFELSERNVRIYDPCYAATAILSESCGGEEKLEKWVSIMKEIMYGYDSVAKLTDAEREAVPYIIMANQLVSTAWFSQSGKYPELYETNVRMTEWIARNFEKLRIS